MNKQIELFGETVLGTERCWFNTISAPKPELKQFTKDAKGQEAVVLKVFESGEKLTALEVKRRTGLNQDSCKRAITVLKNKGKLLKLGKDEMVLEEYGKMNHRYQIK